MQNRRGFTLVELLVVVGIIAVLASLLFTVVGKARDQHKMLLCQHNQHQLWLGVTAFALDHDGITVGNQEDTGCPVPDYRDFLRGSNTAGWQGAPQAGTLWRYVHSTDAYLCPAREHSSGQYQTTSDTDLGSNGHFDYAIFQCFTGAKMQLLPQQAKVVLPDGTQQLIPAPYLVEEAGGASGLNYNNIEGGHATTDTLAHIHLGGSFYIGCDGAVHFLNEPAGVNVKSYWFLSVKSNKWVNCPDNYGYAKTPQNQPFGWWNRQ